MAFSQLPIGRNQSTTKLKGTRSHTISAGFVIPNELNEIKASLTGIASMRVNALTSTCADTWYLGPGQTSPFALLLLMELDTFDTLCPFAVTLQS
jgi:hypothetical protein